MCSLQNCVFALQYMLFASTCVRTSERVEHVGVDIVCIRTRRRHQTRRYKTWHEEEWTAAIGGGLYGAGGSHGGTVLGRVGAPPNLTTRRRRRIPSTPYPSPPRPPVSPLPPRRPPHTL